MPAPKSEAASGTSPVALEEDRPAPPPQNLRALAAAKAAEAQAAKAAADKARLAAVQKNKEAARATRTLRMAQAAKTRADGQLWKAEKQVELAATPDAAQRAEETKALALAQQVQAKAALEKVEAEVAPLLDAVARLREEARAAEDARLAAEDQAKEAARKISPISVFISRKSQRLYVRQSREALFDSPVTIGDADLPLGTYVFTALAYTNDETDLRWTAVSLYNGLPTPAPGLPPAKGQRRHGVDVPAVGTDMAAARSALDRIVIPKEARPAHRRDRVSGLIAHHLGRGDQPRDRQRHRLHRPHEHRPARRHRHPPPSRSGVCALPLPAPHRRQSLGLGPFLLVIAHSPARAGRDGVVCMPRRETLLAFIALVEQGEYVKAIEDFYHPDASMQENGLPPRVGRDKLVDHERAVLAGLEAMRTRRIETFLVDGDRVVINWVFEMTLAGGAVRVLDELALQTWDGDRIRRERFYYDPAQIKPPRD